MVISRIKKPKVRELLATYSWGSMGDTGLYAPQVFFGYTTPSGTELPGRNWIKVALDNIDLETEFKNNFTSIIDIEQAFIKTADKFYDTLQDAFSANVYAWPNITRRRSGEIAGRIRNIVDLQDLKDSQTLIIERM